MPDAAPPTLPFMLLPNDDMPNGSDDTVAGGATTVVVADVSFPVKNGSEPNTSVDEPPKLLPLMLPLPNPLVGGGIVGPLPVVMSVFFPFGGGETASK